MASSITLHDFKPGGKHSPLGIGSHIAARKAAPSAAAAFTGKASSGGLRSVNAFRMCTAGESTTPSTHLCFHPGNPLEASAVTSTHKFIHWSLGRCGPSGSWQCSVVTFASLKAVLKKSLLLSPVSDATPSSNENALPDGTSTCSTKYLCDRRHVLWLSPGRHSLVAPVPASTYTYPLTALTYVFLSAPLGPATLQFASGVLPCVQNTSNAAPPWYAPLKSALEDHDACKEEGEDEGCAFALLLLLLLLLAVKWLEVPLLLFFHP